MTAGARSVLAGSILVCRIAGWSDYFVMATELLARPASLPRSLAAASTCGARSSPCSTVLGLALGYLAGGCSRSVRRICAGSAALLAVSALAELPVVLFVELVLEWLSEAVPDPRYGTPCCRVSHSSFSLRCCQG